MKKIINYEKDIIFKTKIGEISSISLEQDFTIDAECLKGEFILSGEYKVSELSVNKEPFSYKLPLEYEFDTNVDYETLNYDIDNFEYTINNDILRVYIDLGIRYDEKISEPIIPSITEEELNAEDVELPIIKTAEKKDIIEPERTVPILSQENLIIGSMQTDDEYITYHVHIVRDGDTLESIAKKYNSTVELIKTYNNTEILSIKTKLIVPEITNE